MLKIYLATQLHQEALSALSGFDSVSHRDNDIKTVIFHRLVRICNLQKMQIAFLRKLSIMKYVADMSGYKCYIPLKQFAHLALCKPDGLIGKEDIYLYNAVLDHGCCDLA